MKYRVSHSDAAYNKIHCIKGIRQATGLGLREAKEWVEDMVARGYKYLDCSVGNIEILKRDYGFTIHNTEPIIPKELFEFEGSNRFRYDSDGMITDTMRQSVVAWKMPNNMGLFFQSDDGTWKAITYSDFVLVREILAVMG